MLKELDWCESCDTVCVRERERERERERNRSVTIGEEMK